MRKDYWCLKFHDPNHAGLYYTFEQDENGLTMTWPTGGKIHGLPKQVFLMSWVEATFPELIGHCAN